MRPLVHRSFCWHFVWKRSTALHIPHVILSLLHGFLNQWDKNVAISEISVTVTISRLASVVQYTVAYPILWTSCWLINLHCMTLRPKFFWYRIIVFIFKPTLDFFINMKENHACTSYHVNWKGGVILRVFFWIWKSYSILIEKSAVF